MIDEIRKLVEYARTDKTSKNKIVIIDKISDREADLIKRKTNFDLTGYIHVIDKSAINHTLKFHGSVGGGLRGQIAVKETDFILIPEILKSENIIYSNKDKIGNDCLLYQAEIDSVYYYIVEIRTGKKQLAMQTMYKRKRKSKNSFLW